MKTKGHWSFHSVSGGGGDAVNAVWAWHDPNPILQMKIRRRIRQTVLACGRCNKLQMLAITM